LPIQRQWTTDVIDVHASNIHSRKTLRGRGSNCWKDTVLD
jgi:hypothetical protein